MQVIFDTKILNQLDKEIDDFWKEWKERIGVTDEGLDRVMGMRCVVERIRELIMEEG